VHHGSDEATGLANEKPGFSDPQKTKTPESIDIKLDMSDYVGSITPHATFGALSQRGAGLQMHENVDPRVYFFTRYFFYLPRFCTDRII